MPIAEFWIAFGGTVLLTFAIGVCLILDKRRSVWVDRRFPGTGRTNILFGDYGAAGRTEHRMYTTERLYRSFKARKWPIGGALMYLTPCVIVTDARLIEHVLSDEFTKTTLDVRGMRAFRCCWDAFEDERFEDLMRVATEESQSLANVLSAKDESFEDVKAAVELLVVRTLARSLFGKKWNEKHQLPLSNLVESSSWNGFWSVAVSSLPSIQRLKTFLHLDDPSILEELVHSLDSTCSENNYFLEYLKRMESKARRTDRLAFSHTKVLLQELVENVFFFASSTIVACLYELAQLPELQGSLYLLLKRSGDAMVDELDKVIGETLRKYPPVDELSFMSADNNRLPGYELVVPRNTKVIIPIYALHRDAEYYPDPTRFDPTRPMLRSLDRSFPACLYRPLGNKPLPVGTNFAMMLVRVGLTSIIARCRLRVTPETPTHLEMSSTRAIPYPRGKIVLRIEEA